MPGFEVPLLPSLSGLACAGTERSGLQRFAWEERVRVKLPRLGFGRIDSSSAASRAVGKLDGLRTQALLDHAHSPPPVRPRGCSTPRPLINRSCPRLCACVRFHRRPKSTLRPVVRGERGTAGAKCPRNTCQAPLLPALRLGGATILGQIAGAGSAPLARVAASPTTAADCRPQRTACWPPLSARRCGSFPPTRPGRRQPPTPSWGAFARLPTHGAMLFAAEGTPGSAPPCPTAPQRSTSRRGSVQGRANSRRRRLRTAVATSA